MIELVNVEKTYYSKAGDIHALNTTNLSIKAGEIFGIIGLSGVQVIHLSTAASICLKDRQQDKYLLMVKNLLL